MEKVAVDVLETAENPTCDAKLAVVNKNDENAPKTTDVEKGLGPVEQTIVKPEPVEVFDIVQEHVEEQPNMSLIHLVQEVQGARVSLRVSK